MLNNCYDNELLFVILNIIIYTYIIGKGELFQSLLDGLLILTTTASSSLSALSSSLSTSTNALETMGDMNHLLNTKILKNTTKLIGNIICYIVCICIYYIYISISMVSISLSTFIYITHLCKI